MKRRGLCRVPQFTGLADIGFGSGWVLPVPPVEPVDRIEDDRPSEVVALGQLDPVDGLFEEPAQGGHDLVDARRRIDLVHEPTGHLASPSAVLVDPGRVERPEPHGRGALRPTPLVSILLTTGLVITMLTA